jgi:hypothetical protein
VGLGEEAIRISALAWLHRVTFGRLRGDIAMARLVSTPKRSTPGTRMR